MGPSTTLFLLTCVCGFVSASQTCWNNCNVNETTVIDCDGVCTDGCLPGYYGDRCTLTCDVHCQTVTCQQLDGACLCDRGYNLVAGSCIINRGVKCKQNKHCWNNICDSTAREECLSGCISGRFGSFCSETCREHCLCEQESGNCTSCEAGWYGDECQSQCRPGCREKSCHRNGSCVGDCTPGLYGEKCEWTCPDHCYGDECDINGICISCKPGFYGTACQQRCLKCTGSVCSQTTGKCTIGCQSGFYGEACSMMCGKCIDGVCEQITRKCPNGCQSGFYGEACSMICGTCTDGVCNQTTGECINGCQNGFYGDVCTKTCGFCRDGVCNDTTGECREGCESGYYGSFCNLRCEDCEGGDCDTDTGECRHKEEKGDTWSGVQYWVGGGVAVVIIAAVLVYMSCRMKRMHGVIYDVVKWRRRPPSAVQDTSHGVVQDTSHGVVQDTSHGVVQGASSGAVQDTRPGVVQDVSPGVAPGYAKVDDEVTVTAPRVCLRPIRQTSYIRPRHSGDSTDNLQIHPQAAAAPPSDIRLHVLRRSDEWSERPDSYVLPNYVEIDEDLIVSLPQPSQAAEGPTPVVNNSSFSVVADVHVQVEDPDSGNATGGAINIPLIADCFGNADTEDSASDEEPRPDVENYDHLFRDDYEQS